jgi:hypothetical protein
MRFYGIAVSSYAGAVSSNGSHLAPSIPEDFPRAISKLRGLNARCSTERCGVLALDLVPPMALDARPILSALRT